MSYSRKPGPVDDSHDSESASPMAPDTTSGDSGPVGMKGGGGTCGGAPRLRGWPRAISWRGDFPDEREERPPGEDEDAQIHPEAILDDNVSVCRSDGRFRLGNFAVRLTIVAEDTWVVRSAKSDALLAHEQGHFDISGLDARQLMSDLAALRADTTDELQRLVSERIERSRTDSQAMSDRYDTETNHSRNADVQRRWEAAIREATDGGHALRPPA
jgi:hypothetical protein